MNKLLAMTFALLISWPAILTSAADGDGIVFIVHADNPVETVSPSNLKDYFLKRKRKWPDGSSVRFIDRNDSPERKIFLESIMKQTSEEIDLYWIGQKLYSGDSAPVRGSSDSMTIHFVATFKGAIGYISKSTPLKNKAVKTIAVGN